MELPSTRLRLFSIKLNEINGLIVGSKATLEYKDALVDDPKQRRPDITLAKTWLNWSPKVTIAEGLNKTIEYFRNELLVQHHSERNLFFPEEWLHSSGIKTTIPKDHKEL
ncbi:unnamed protein product [Adineta steineri]|uniref:UDP-glucuronate decarboxylase n=1 Tax=Adineta steineri TaxID=433720 RepID=A0A820HZT2_9BILA|nr:unnamed protein product [Adineta steineri]CAF4304209.1 unnamed protein product [Adineta steineri]